MVLDCLLRDGSVTTETLKQFYDHPPRAIRDLREAGVPLETSRQRDSRGRSMAVYRLGDLAKIEQNKLGGRLVFSKAFKQELIARYGSRCATCNQAFQDRYLQIDHRVPYGVAGDNLSKSPRLQEFMLLCGTCNRRKSWSCETCPNWVRKDPDICSTCYWASPDTEEYAHVATLPMRRLDVTWSGDDVRVYDRLRMLAKRNRVDVQIAAKELLAKALGNP